VCSVHPPPAFPCRGFREPTISLSNKVLSIEPLYSERGALGWYTVHGVPSIFSAECKQFTFNQAGACESCANLPHTQAFQKTVQRRSRPTPEGGNLRTKNALLSTGQLLARKSAMQQQLRLKDATIRKLNLKLARATLRITSLLQRLAGDAERGDLRAMANKIEVAVSDGTLGQHTRPQTLSVLKNALANFTLKTRAQRYNDNSMAVYMVLSIWGGPRVAAFAAANFGGPSSTTIQRSLGDIVYRMEPGLPAIISHFSPVFMRE
jgi:hypothetical protein